MIIVYDSTLPEEIHLGSVRVLRHGVITAQLPRSESVWQQQGRIKNPITDLCMLHEIEA